MKKIICYLMAIMMAATMVPYTAFAAFTASDNVDIGDIELDMEEGVEEWPSDSDETDTEDETGDNDACAHKWGHWETKTAATCTSDGIKVRSCEKCKAEEEGTIPAAETVKLETTKFTYDGSFKELVVIVKDKNGETVDNDNYDVSYTEGITKVGRYKVTVEFEGDYSGTETLYYTIVPKAPSTLSLRLSTASKGYDNVKVSWSKATGATGYYVYYKRSTSSKYTLLKRTTETSLVTKSLYDGKKYYFKVIPYYKKGDVRYKSLQSKTNSIYTLKKMGTPKVTRSGSKVKVKWTNISGESGYQISKSTKKTGTNIVSTYKTTKGTYKKLAAKKGKKYYYKVRAYKSEKVGSKYVKVYGPWSNVKAYKR